MSDLLTVFVMAKRTGNKVMMNKDELALTFPFNISLLLLIFFKPALKKGKCQDIDQ